MKKISRKHININDILIFYDLKVDFYIVNLNQIKDLNKDNNFLYKKGLYRYLLPGKFEFNIKNYFKLHTYVNLNFNKSLLSTYILNQDIVIFKYNNKLFLNNISILRNNNFILNIENLSNICIFKKFIIYCLMFYVE